MPSEWAMEEAWKLIPVYEFGLDSIEHRMLAAALDAAREEGAREMRGQAADVCSGLAKASQEVLVAVGVAKTAEEGDPEEELAIHGIAVAEDLASAIRALPLPGADTTKGG